jgi:hypothetical protein
MLGRLSHCEEKPMHSDLVPTDTPGPANEELSLLRVEVEKWKGCRAGCSFPFSEYTEGSRLVFSMQMFNLPMPAIGHWAHALH